MNVVNCLFWDELKSQLMRRNAAAVFCFFVTIIYCVTTCELGLCADKDNTEDGKTLSVAVTVDIFPEKIHYGDVCFARFFATNQGKKAVYCTSGSDILDAVTTDLCHGDELLQRFNQYMYNNYDGFCTPAQVLIKVKYPRQILQHSETMMFHLRAAWLPVPELAGQMFVRRNSEYGDPLPAGMVVDRFRDIVEQKKDIFDINFHLDGFHFLSFSDTNNNTKKELLADATDIPDKKQEIFVIKQLTTSGYKLSADALPIIKDYAAYYKVRSKICIIPRSKEILSLIHLWYFEIPSTVNLNREWTSHGLFAHPHHAVNAPLPTGDREMRDFFALMRTRTPELLSRIKRTKELETKLLKLPESELSQNMKELIQLRGHLVDIRFAENEMAENKAFDNFVKFIDKSKDKELWIRFVIEIGFNSIVDHEYFPYKKAEDYCK
ncbi:MAG: hypothetical protein LBJ00_17915, partial [Planctomycetaceae bacterium]|nr:hypothetical protein [Planctomycetaceae bacterium]